MSNVETDLIRQYEILVDEWVLAALLRGSRTLTELLQVLPGVYPAQVLEAVARLSFAQKIDTQVATKIIEEAQRPTSNLAPVFVRSQRLHLPVPHPLDYDWRFTEDAIHRLANLCLENTQVGDTVALLGIPSVFSMAVELAAQRNLILIDSNPAIVESLVKDFPGGTILQCNLLKEPVPEGTAATVMLDPPWYMEYFTAFLWAASRLCRVNGKVIVSLPPLGTRPGIVSERTELLAYADKSGLVLDSLSLAVLPYNMPPFEVNALRKAGIFGVPPDWRRGDLAVFTKYQVREMARPCTADVAEPLWVEHRIGAVRIRIKQTEEEGFADPTLISLIDGNILTTVSRREPLRTRVDVWTSGNRVFACQGGGILQQILKAIAQGDTPEKEIREGLARGLTEKETRLIQRATRQIKDLIDQEQQEYGY